MCIRDRPTAGRGDRGLRCTHGGRLVDDQLGEREATRQWVAVSYTHLRAHETVLDLVCRLLLEKKNNANQYRDTTAYAAMAECVCQVSGE